MRQAPRRRTPARQDAGVKETRRKQDRAGEEGTERELEGKSAAHACARMLWPPLPARMPQKGVLPLWSSWETMDGASVGTNAAMHGRLLRPRP